VLEPDRLSDTRFATAALVFAAIHVSVGLLAARWWAVVLPVLAVLLAVPAGYPDVSQGEPLPIWVGLLVMLPIAIPAVAAGVLATEVLASRRRSARSS
jgi:ABC-type sulfate transport system permease component